MRQRRDRGDILVQTILFISVITVIVGGISALMFTHLRWSNHEDNLVRAKLAARAALNTAIGELAANQEFSEEIVFRPHPDDEGAEQAFLTFDRESGQPFSTNNTRNSVAVESWDGPAHLSDGVAMPNSAHLVAVGTCRNARYVAEARIVYPPYPYALASTGQIRSEGTLEVLGVANLADADDGITEEEKREGHIVSNSDAADAVTLSSQAEISGDVRAVGGVNTNGATVHGQVRAGYRESDLPRMGLTRPPGNTDKTLFISDYDPDNFTDGRSLRLTPGEAEEGALAIAGQRVKVQATGSPLRLNDGVTLEDGMLYVEGDVEIRGGVKGTGAIVATGKVTVYGASSLAGEQTALVSGGGVDIDGQGLGISKFRGLVATMGDFEADSTSIVGSYLAAGRDPVTSVGTSRMTLRDVHAVHAEDAQAMDISVHVELQEMLRGGQAGYFADGSQIGLLHGGTFYTLTGDPSLTAEQRAEEVQATYNSLKGVQGQAHPMAHGQVVMRSRGGDYSTVADLSGSRKLDLQENVNRWNSYITSLERNEARVYSIFEIDLNRFTSGSTRLKILTYR